MAGRLVSLQTLGVGDCFIHEGEGYLVLAMAWSPSHWIFQVQDIRCDTSILMSGHRSGFEVLPLPAAEFDRALDLRHEELRKDTRNLEKSREHEMRSSFTREEVKTEPCPFCKEFKLCVVEADPENVYKPNAYVCCEDCDSTYVLDGE